MKKEFRTLVKREKIDLISYIKNYVSTFPDTEILIGCDSQNRKRESIYALVIGLYKPGKGAHVIYSKFATNREKEKIGRAHV